MTETKFIESSLFILLLWHLLGTQEHSDKFSNCKERDEDTSQHQCEDIY